MMTTRSDFDSSPINYTYNFNGNTGYIIKQHQPYYSEPNSPSDLASGNREPSYISWNVLPSNKFHKKIAKKKRKKRRERRKKLKEKRKHRNKFLRDMMIGMMAKVIEIIPIAKVMTVLLFTLLLFAKKALLISLASLIIVGFDVYKKSRPGTKPTNHYPFRGEDDKYWWQEFLLKNRQSHDRFVNPPHSDKYALPPIDFLIPYLDRLRIEDSTESSIDRSRSPESVARRTKDKHHTRAYLPALSDRFDSRGSASSYSAPNIGEVQELCEPHVVPSRVEMSPVSCPVSSNGFITNENLRGKTVRNKNLDRILGSQGYFAVPQASRPKKKINTVK